jgi:hypothetical protein
MTEQQFQTLATIEIFYHLHAFNDNGLHNDDDI